MYSSASARTLSRRQGCGGGWTIFVNGVLTQMEQGLDCRPCKRLETISDTEPTEDGVLAKAKNERTSEQAPVVCCDLRTRPCACTILRCADPPNLSTRLDNAVALSTCPQPQQQQQTALIAA